MLPLLKLEVTSATSEVNALLMKGGHERCFLSTFAMQQERSGRSPCINFTPTQSVPGLITRSAVPDFCPDQLEPTPITCATGQGNVRLLPWSCAMSAEGFRNPNKKQYKKHWWYQLPTRWFRQVDCHLWLWLQFIGCNKKILIGKWHVW